MDATASAANPGVGCHVLVIEDNADGRFSLGLLLERLGCQVALAEDGVEGVVQALSERPQLAVVDIGLPHLDGYQVARLLRAAFGDQILLIAHTAYGRPEDQQRAYKAGFDAYLLKPLVLQRLTEYLAVAARRPRPRAPSELYAVSS
jgi:two-component system, sensor histidine kinase